MCLIIMSLCGSTYIHDNLVYTYTAQSTCHYKESWHWLVWKQTKQEIKFIFVVKWDACNIYRQLYDEDLHFGC